MSIRIIPRLDIKGPNLVKGIQLVNKFDGEFPKKHFQTFLDYCDIDKDYFDEVIDSWRSPHLWKKNDKNEWELIHKLS